MNKSFVPGTLRSNVEDSSVLPAAKQLENRTIEKEWKY